ncbi:hypothetical protein RB653_009245 [Dictyostelium firmibasis]|uniref:Uncharacterized protein n=1 Tax=Dictyostelium firmibasis TaxID=79012 RepID=A0AAN7YUX1_9MYCE
MILKNIINFNYNNKKIIDKNVNLNTSSSIGFDKNQISTTDISTLTKIIVNPFICL